MGETLHSRHLFSRQFLSLRLESLEGGGAPRGCAWGATASKVPVADPSTWNMNTIQSEVSAHSRTSVPAPTSAPAPKLPPKVPALVPLRLPSCHHPSHLRGPAAPSYGVRLCVRVDLAGESAGMRQGQAELGQDVEPAVVPGAARERHPRRRQPHGGQGMTVTCCAVVFPFRLLRLICHCACAD